MQLPIYRAIYRQPNLPDFSPNPDARPMPIYAFDPRELDEAESGSPWLAVEVPDGSRLRYDSTSDQILLHLPGEPDPLFPNDAVARFAPPEVVEEERRLTSESFGP